MANLPTENNNPGDLRFAGQTNATQGKGGFAAFPTAKDGMSALLNQLQTNITRSPNETLADFSSKYAPASDGNDPAKYTADLSNQLGVAPNATLSSLEPKIGQFADAVAKNEGYNIENDPAGLQGAASSVGQAINKVPGGAPTALGVGGLLTAGATALAPEIGGVEGLLSGAGNLVKGGLTDIGLGSLFGGNNSTNTSSEQTQQTTPPSPTASAVNNVLSQTVGGNATSQEAQARGIPNIGTSMEANGLVPSVDENGNYDKVSPTLIANAKISEQGNALALMAKSMDTKSSLNELEKDALQEAEKQMQGSPHLIATKEKIHKTFDNYRAMQPEEKDKYGNPYKSTFHVSPEQLLKMRQRSSEGSNWSTPHHERKASQHIYNTFSKKLSEIAKAEKKGDWDKTNKKIEELYVLKKAIKHLPKKAQRDFKKEFLHDLMAGVGGGLIGKTLGNGILGGTAGYLLASKLGKKHYKSLSKKGLITASPK